MKGWVDWVLVRRWAFGCLLFAVLALGIAYVDYDDNRRLEGAPGAPAVITDVVRFAKGGPYLEVDVSLPDGRVARTTITDFFDYPKPEKGGRIRVQYRVDGRDLLARENGVPPDRSEQIGWGAAGLVTLLVGVGILVRHTRRWRKRTWGQFWFYGNCPDCAHDWRQHPGGVYGVPPGDPCADCHHKSPDALDTACRTPAASP
ncbi:hypothetical protein F1D05_22105 [Kribbella qitaiheensis]|uniref:Uncharacterized protein n=1 Tax=Kribbella qitaiheensis TaxID=1544730 RepID=A0A7G6X1J8_9ACTN|nr:hypothetical protein [Kribbella qitaiheensis]QNE20113.1 hypothetical protein F1D05_22105 [Kribbella qitaiheensis]